MLVYLLFLSLSHFGTSSDDIDTVHQNDSTVQIHPLIEKMEKMSKSPPGMELSVLADSRKILQDVISSSIPVAEAISGFIQGKRDDKLAKKISAIVLEMTNQKKRIDTNDPLQSYYHEFKFMLDMFYHDFMLDRVAGDEFIRISKGDDTLQTVCTKYDPWIITQKLAEYLISCDTGLDGKLVQHLLSHLDRKGWKPMVDGDRDLWLKSRIWNKFASLCIYNFLERPQHQNHSEINAEQKIDEFVQKSNSLGITYSSREEFLQGLEEHLFPFGYSKKGCILKSHYLYNQFKTENVLTMAFKILEHLNLLGYYSTVCSHVLNPNNTDAAKSAIDEFLKDAEPIINMLSSYPSVLLNSSWPEVEMELIKQRVRVQNEKMIIEEGKWLPDNATCEKFNKVVFQKVTNMGHPSYKKQTVMFYGSSTMETDLDEYFHFTCRKDVCSFIPGEHVNVLIIRSAGGGTSDRLTEYTNNVSSIILNSMPKYRSWNNVETVVTELANQENLSLANLQDHQGFAVIRYEQFSHPCPFPAFSLKTTGNNGTETNNQVLYYWDAKNTLRRCQTWLFLFF